MTLTLKIGILRLLEANQLVHERVWLDEREGGHFSWGKLLSTQAGRHMCTHMYTQRQTHVHTLKDQGH